jgi:MYXO-CTERM domain-containing protein
MKRSFRCLLAALPLCLSAVAHAQELPNFDAYAAQPALSAQPARAHGGPAAVVASRDAKRGAPSFLWAAKPAVGGRAAHLSHEAAARWHLGELAARYGVDASALASMKVVQVHDLGRGGVIVQLRQAPGGVELHRSDVKVLMDRAHELVAVGGSPHPAGGVAPKGAAFTRSLGQAITAAFRDLYGVALSPAMLVDRKEIKGGYDHFDLGALPGYRFVHPARVKPVYFPLADRLVPAYFVELVVRKGHAVTADAYDYVIAADDGRLLQRVNLTHHDTWQFRTYADATGDHRPMDGPIVDFTPHPTGKPDGSAPGFAPPNLVSIDAFNKTRDPWLPPGAMVTTGNNVDAYTDDVDENYPTPDGFKAPDLRASATAPGVFDRTYDPLLDPQASSDQKMASVTSLFYTTNWLHDWWYDSGFDEAAGNAQTSNFGRGGLEGDALWAQAQDGAPGQRDNSNMQAMVDGASPIMQMFVWDGVGSSTLGVTPLNQNLGNGVASFGPGTFDVSAAVVLVDDGTAPVTDACEAITNDLTGKIALLDRGSCSFQLKVYNAQQKGAVGVILADNKANEPPPPLGDDASVPAVSIPVLSVTQADGDALKAALQSGAVTASLARTTSVDRDGTLDNDVVAHEWGHYIHLRQVGCASAACSAESEGWGDFFALHTMVRSGDDLHGAFPMAQYATAAFPDDPAYFGIRRFPYSIDFAKNPLTFQHIGDGVPLPTSAPIAQGNAQAPNSEAHAAGEVWAAMLFEAYVALLERASGPTPAYSFDEARRRMGDYVEGGLKLAPYDPTFTEQRDAILAAAAAADVDDLATLAAAFARRGAGTCAVSPPRDSQDLTGVVENFTVEANLSIVSMTVDDSVMSCDKDGHLDAEETGLVTIQVMNTGTVAITGAGATVASTSADVSFPEGASLTFDAIPPLGTATGKLKIALSPTMIKLGTVDLSATLTNAKSCGQAGKLETAPMVNFDEKPAAATLDTVEADDTTWTLVGDGAEAIWARQEIDLGNRAWTGIDFASPSDTALVSPSLQVSTTEKLVMSFAHRYTFEQSQNINWDGSVIEVSSDAGKTWQDISKYGDPGYGGEIGDPQGQAQNVLRNRQGYVGTSAAWPALEKVQIDMGSALAGKTIQVRFRIGTDDAAGGAGWSVDDIGFQGITNQPFPALIDDRSTCGAAPIANAGPDQMVKGGVKVTLDGSASVDPGQLPLTYKWKQTKGTAVELGGATSSKPTFVAPSATATTTLSFELTVSDGKKSATDAVDIVVTPGGSGNPGDNQALVVGGCGCETTGRDAGTGGAVASLLALGALAMRRRRR